MALIICSECGRQISDKAIACPQCGAPVEVKAQPKTETVNSVKTEIKSEPKITTPTPKPTPTPSSSQQKSYHPFEDNPEGKKRGLAAIFAFTLGWAGVHMFYMGKKGAGFTFIGAFLFSIILTVEAFAGIFLLLGISAICTVQGIRFLTMPHEEFVEGWLKNEQFLKLF